MKRLSALGLALMLFVDIAWSQACTSAQTTTTAVEPAEQHQAERRPD